MTATRLPALWITATLVAASPALAQPAAPPTHVLVANDDGVDAPGIAALVAVLAADPSYRVTVAAPAHAQSGQGHALVIRGEICAWRHEPLSGCPAWAVDATPATVVRLALTALVPDDLPRLVLSGINRGENSGRTAWYSGTLGAAREAVLAGIPAIAVSLQLDWADPRPDFAGAARWTKPVVDAVRAHPLPKGVVLNVNIPRDVTSARGYRIGRMGLADDAVNNFEVVREEDGVLWLTGKWAPPKGDEPGTDTAALEQGWVSVVPLGVDQTVLDALPALDQLGLPGAEASASRTGARFMLWVLPLALVVLVVCLALLQSRARPEGR